MKTSETVREIKNVSEWITTAEALAIAEKMRNENLTMNDLLAQNQRDGLTKVEYLLGVAGIQIDFNHRDWKTQAPIHDNDCLVCGAMKLGK